MHLKKVPQYLFAALCSMAAWCASAEVKLPSAIRIITPLASGPPSDFATRIAAEEMGKILKIPVYVENKPGANGWVAMQELLRAKPDGSTLMLGGISPLSLNIAMTQHSKYDPLKDVTPIGGIYNGFQAYLVSAKLPVNSMDEFLAYAKQRPGGVSVGHYSALTEIQYAALAKLSSVKFLMTPYKSNATAMNDLMAGTIDASMTDIAGAVELAKGGKVKVLAHTLSERTPLAQGIAAIDESVKGASVPAWSGIIGPRGMSPELVQLLNTTINKALATSAVQQKFASTSLKEWVISPESYQQHIAQELVRWKKVAGENGLIKD